VGGPAVRHRQLLDPEYVCIYGMSPTEWYRRGCDFSPRTTLEAVRDRLGGHDRQGRASAMIPPRNGSNRPRCCGVMHDGPSCLSCLPTYPGRLRASCVREVAPPDDTLRRPTSHRCTRIRGRRKLSMPNCWTSHNSMTLVPACRHSQKCTVVLVAPDYPRVRAHRQSSIVAGRCVKAFPLKSRSFPAVSRT